MANRRYNTQVAQPRGADRVKKAVGGIAKKTTKPITRQRRSDGRVGDLKKFKLPKDIMIVIEDNKLKTREKKAGGGMGGRSGEMMYSRGQGVNMRSKRVPTELMDRGAMKKGGKVLKPVPAGKKGLSKLPTNVRNKMGFMKKGGKVKKFGGGGGVRGSSKGSDIYSRIKQADILKKIRKNFKGKKK